MRCRVTDAAYAAAASAMRTGSANGRTLNDWTEICSATVPCSLRCAGTGRYAYGPRSRGRLRDSFHARLSHKGGLSGGVKRLLGCLRTFCRVIGIRSCCCRRRCGTGCLGITLAWFLLDSVKALELSAFYDAYRADGHGRAAYEPSMMVGLVLYAYATNERSARGIERHCRDDVAYRVITANVIPDHATIARFLVRHEQSLAALFASVLRLCARAGLVESKVVAIDGTKMLANANRDHNVDYDRIAREILEEAKAVDAAEDELYGDKRGDELPEELTTPEGRRAWLKRELARERAERTDASEPAPGAAHEFDAEQIVARTQGPRGLVARGQAPPRARPLGNRFTGPARPGAAAA